jgi:hypothetical protein
MVSASLRIHPPRNLTSFACVGHVLMMSESGHTFWSLLYSQVHITWRLTQLSDEAAFVRVRPERAGSSSDLWAFVWIVKLVNSEGTTDWEGLE